MPPRDLHSIVVLAASREPCGASRPRAELHRISRVISQHGCEVDLVLIATEGERAIDVFHITKAGAKLTQAEQQALTADLQRTLEGTA